MAGLGIEFYSQQVPRCEYGSAAKREKPLNRDAVRRYEDRLYEIWMFGDKIYASISEMQSNRRPTDEVYMNLPDVTFCPFEFGKPLHHGSDDI